MKTKSDKVYKGMVFAGCSFTWGQGLYYYSNLPTLVPPINEYTFNTNSITETHMEFLKSKRFSRLVANHFGTFEMVHPFNSGSTQSIISYWRSKLGLRSRDMNDWVTPLHYVDISYLVFQCTQWIRNEFDMEVDGKSYRIAGFDALQESHLPVFQKWLDSQNLTIDEWESRSKQENMNMIKEFLQEVESYGIETMILTWPDENVEWIKRDDWLSDRFMPIKYGDETYDSIESLTKARSESVICGDFASFEIPPKDHHLSLKLHKIMAENIINYLEK